MNEQQRQVRIERWNNYRGSAYRRWRVLSTFLTGFLIGLFYVLLISGWPSFGLNAEGHSNLVLIFSGILGGVIYSILVDEHIEMPRFIANKGDEFEAGLFGDILLGIAGAIVLEVIRQQLAPNTQEPAPVGIAAVGIIGGYGGRAILQFALQRVFKDINVLDVDRQKYLQTSLQRRLEGMDSLELIDQINQQVNVGLAPAEIAELASAIKQSAVGSRLRIYTLAKEFRRAAKLAGETARIERIIPIFKALIESDPQQHSYYAELAFAYKDSDSPDLFQVIQYLDKAIALRGNQQRAETWNYELSRAITRIQEAYKALGSYDFDPAVHERIITDLLAVAEIYNLENILKEVSDQHVPVPIFEWMQHNQAMLAAHPKAKVLIGQLDTLVGNESVGNESTDSQPANSQPANSQPAAPFLEPVPSPPIKPTSPSSPSILPQPPEKPVVIFVTDNNIPQVGIALIKKLEGYAKERADGHAEAYPDVIHGWKVATIGYGTTSYPDGTKVKQGDVITRDQAEAYLIQGLEHNYKKALEKIPTWAQMNINQRAALYSFAYNLGAYFYKGADFDSITRVCDSPNRWADQSWISEQFLKYINRGTSAEVGLRDRRRAEANLFCQPVAVRLDKSSNQLLAQFAQNNLSLVPDLVAENIPLATQIQVILISFGLLEPPADGKFGPLSTEALLNFQEKMVQKIPNLVQEKGFLGPLTAKALIAVTPAQFPKPSLNLGNDLASRIIKYMQAKRYQISTEKQEYNIVYVEGMNVDGTLNNDAPNCFNDVRMVIEFTGNKPQIVGRWEATTEPGSYYTYHPMNPKGAARIQFGQYKAWQVDKHCGKSSGCHEALVQTGQLTVHRDFDKNMQRTGDKLDTSSNLSINQHWGFDMPKNDIGFASAGCLVGRTRQGHREFMEIIKRDKRYSKTRQYTFQTTIIPGDDLEKCFPPS